MNSIGERLRAHWHAQGLDPPPGVTEDRLRDFEKHYEVSLPTDLRKYFLHVDGMGVFTYDDDLFNFCQLSEFVPIDDLEIVVEDPTRHIDVEDLHQHFVFADHSIWLPAYAIRLARSGTDSHRVIALGSESNPRRGYTASVVASSFSDFVERYLGDENSRDRLTYLT
jgi:cell wall assembly regulator SMI1